MFLGYFSFYYLIIVESPNNMNKADNFSNTNNADAPVLVLYSEM